MKTIIKAVCLATVIGSVGSVVAEDNVTLKTTELAQGIYMMQGVGGFTGGNILLSVGDDGVVMIDDGLPPFLSKVKASVKKLTDKDVDFLINTHVHGDHTGNNADFGAGKTHIVAHQNMRHQMVTTGVPNQEGTVPMAALPIITYSDQMAFHLNGADTQLIHVAHAHTDGDTVVYFPDKNIIHTGDVLFNGMFPYIDLGSGGSVAGYLAAQKMLYAMANDKTQLVPGHGPLANKADLKAAIDMLEDSIARVQQWISKGLSEDQVVAKNPLKKYHQKWNWGFITTEKMTRTLYKDITGAVTSHNHKDKQAHKH
ncbi:MAG TPA: MBL fold metallo-hydrolase [Marinagarivorans sp.]